MAGEKHLTAKYVSQFTAIKALLAVTVYALTVGTIAVLDYSAEMVTLVAVAALITIALKGLEYVGAIFTSWERISYEALVNGVDRVLLLAVAGGVLWMGHGVLAMCAAVAVVRMFSLVLGLVLVSRRVAAVRPSVDLSFWFRCLRRTLPLAVLVLLTTVYVRIDIVLLSLFEVGNEQIGWYSASMKMFDVIVAVPFMVMAGLFPIFSDLYRHDRPKVPVLFAKTLKLMLIVAFPIAVGGYFAANGMVSLIYGSGFLGTSIAFRILTWRLFFSFVNLLSMNVLIATGHERKAALGAGLGVVVNVCLNAILIPRYGYEGAAVVAVATDVVVCFAWFYFILRAIPNVGGLDVVWRPLCGAAIMGLALFILGRQNLLIILAVGAGVYGLTQWAFGTLTAEELNVLRNLGARDE